MTNETENLVLEHLRRLREDMRGGFSGLSQRVSTVEQGVGNIQVQMGHIQSQIGHVTMLGSLHQRINRLDDHADGGEHRIGQLEERIHRIERRLDLVES